MQLNDSVEKFENLGIAVAAVSYDAPDANQRFIDSKSISYQLLSDVDVQTVKRMGILNTNFAEDHPAFGVPKPGYAVCKFGWFDSIETGFRGLSTATQPG